MCRNDARCPTRPGARERTHTAMRSVISNTPQIVRLAAHRACSFGAVSLAALTDAGYEEGLSLSEDEARSALGPGAEFLADDWFWLPAQRCNRVAALGRRILAVAAPLDVATVRAGVVRTYPR